MTTLPLFALLIQWEYDSFKQTIKNKSTGLYAFPEDLSKGSRILERKQAFAWDVEDQDGGLHSSVSIFLELPSCPLTGVILLASALLTTSFTGLSPLATTGPAYVLPFLSFSSKSRSDTLSY